MKTIRLLILFFLLLTAGCSTATLTSVDATSTPIVPTATPTPFRTYTPLPPPTEHKVVLVHLRESSSLMSTATLFFGDTARIQLELEPIILAVTRDSAGKVLQTSMKPWAEARLKDMRVCFSLDKACGLDGLEWSPYQAKVEMEYPVDWLGSRQLYVLTQVRDDIGAVVPIYLGSSEDPAPQAQTSYELIGQVNTATPLEKQPSVVLTALFATRMAFPVSGSVQIEGGKCCAGGVAGSTIPVQVAFNATSTAGKVSEMRVKLGGGCHGTQDAQSLDAPWEPFVPSKSYSATLAINWVGWYISVQYQDDQGNLSPVYCADISLEGSPPQPTP